MDSLQRPVGIALKVRANQLTGTTRFRSNWRGKLILQVEYYAESTSDDCHYPRAEYQCKREWRDATLEDLKIHLPMSIAVNTN